MHVVYLGSDPREQAWCRNETEGKRIKDSWVGHHLSTSAWSWGIFWGALGNVPLNYLWRRERATPHLFQVVHAQVPSNPCRLSEARSRKWEIPEQETRQSCSVLLQMGCHGSSWRSPTGFEVTHGKCHHPSLTNGLSVLMRPEVISVHYDDTM